MELCGIRCYLREAVPPPMKRVVRSTDSGSLCRERAATVSTVRQKSDDKDEPSSSPRQKHLLILRRSPPL